MLDTSNKTNWDRPRVAQQVTQPLIRGLMTIIPVSLDKITILVSKRKIGFLTVIGQ